ncbi:MAG: A/G-specific adenine glycosylase [Oscillospiraceae bacterium]|nr:A/G-specific adenine glycosylase [Oscillospiraceae bacterium]
MEPLEQLTVPLLEWFRDNARSLPWRDDPTPYHVWLSEIMLQQTRVAAVLDYYRRFLEQAPDIAALAALPEERLMKLWQGLGYYNRARNLQRAAQVIVEEYGGVFPADYAAVRALPGVGDYTAGAICSIAFGQAEPAVDGNVLRVYARIMGDDGDIAAPQMKRKVAQAVGEIIPLNAAGTFNQALMELGATVCLPNGTPLCQRCPAQGFCAALAQGRTGELPVKAPKKARRVEKRAVWLIFWDNRVALRRRPDKGLLAGLWEFPNELFGGQGPEQWGIDAELQAWGAQAKHIFTHIEWHMSILPAQAKGPPLPPGWVWAGGKELEEKYAVPNAFDRALECAKRRLNGGA